MCTLGTGFDTDPQLEWASETLTDRSTPSDMIRAERLHQKMVAYLDVVAGPDRRYATAALQRLLAFNFDKSEWSEQSMLTALGDLYPQKFEFIGESAARRLFQLAGREAAKSACSAGKGGAALAGTMFAMGHRICEDPFYPWVSATLKDPRIVDGERRLNRLAAKLKTYGTQVARLLQSILNDAERLSKTTDSPAHAAGRPSAGWSESDQADRELQHVRGVERASLVLAPMPVLHPKPLPRCLPNRARTSLGVGKSAQLTFSLGSGTWTQSPPFEDAGSLSGTSGATVTCTAPERATTVTITATRSGCTATDHPHNRGAFEYPDATETGHDRDTTQ